MKSEEDLKRVINVYADMIRRICFLHLKNQYDTEDVFQNVYMKYLLCEKVFESREHEKAWFVRVAINACTDHLRYLSRRRWVPLEVINEETAVLDETGAELLEIVLALPEKYRNVIYLYYYEQYSAVEIAGILGRKENTVYSWLSRAKEMLRDRLGGDWA
ncbi:MAG: sigma-70 family RNA polymerase sigma factor [Dorea sp.]|nr:sigma-70 family RNA polymerase sigma factor [Dorea sp.]